MNLFFFNGALGPACYIPTRYRAYSDSLAQTLHADIISLVACGRVQSQRGRVREQNEAFPHRCPRAQNEASCTVTVEAGTLAPLIIGTCGLRQGFFQGPQRMTPTSNRSRDNRCTFNAEMAIKHEGLNYKVESWFVSSPSLTLEVCVVAPKWVRYEL